MAATLNTFYLKYRNKVARTLENDPYYQYLFDLVEGSENTIQQTNRILHKEVDEKWLTRVEDGITAIDMIIAKPRRFIATKEEVVPVELAKKITADSVKHLSRNTQFIGDMQDGNIRPSKILNVSTEESFNLYENRFIYTLIKKLVAFIDKRTDIIFWSTGDEKESHLCLSSDLEDDYETISYKLEMNVKNKQSYMETDAQHMEVFKRIDRVRRIVMEFRRSPFMEMMSGLPEVRSPIQRTNLLMKDPYYKRCYTLWAFLEQYDDVGYSIDVKESALDFDEEYLYQMYTNMIMNYTVFKSLLEDDNRPIDKNIKKRKKIKPKFVKQIVEEIVDDYDIPDVEVRKVIIEEITRAQARIEQRQAEAEKRRQDREKKKEKERLEKEKEQEKKRAAAEKEKSRLKAIADKEKARLKAIADKEKAKQKELEEKEKARKKELAEKEKARQKALAEKEKEKKRLAAERERAKLAEQKAKEKEKARLKALAEKEKTKQKELAEKEKARQKAEEEKEKARKKELAEKEKARQKALGEKEQEKKRLAADRKKVKPAEQKAAEIDKTVKAGPEAEMTTAEANTRQEAAPVRKKDNTPEAAAARLGDRKSESAHALKIEPASESPQVKKETEPKAMPKTPEELERERRLEAVRRANEAAKRKAAEEQEEMLRRIRESQRVE